MWGGGTHLSNGDFLGGLRAGLKGWQEMCGGGVGWEGVARRVGSVTEAG